jgi:hypothetical protein
MRTENTFDGQERVMSWAAYDLQVLATAHSAARALPLATGKARDRDKVCVPRISAAAVTSKVALIAVRS